MKYIPEMTYNCYICNKVFTVYTKPVNESYFFTPSEFIVTPIACPHCKAPIKSNLMSPESVAAELIMIYFKNPSISGDTPEKFLERELFRPEDINKCLEAILNVDFNEWELRLKKQLKNKWLPKKQIEKELNVIKKARIAILNGSILTNLESKISKAKTKIMSRYESFLENYKKSNSQQEQSD